MLHKNYINKMYAASTLSLITRRHTVTVANSFHQSKSLAVIPNKQLALMVVSPNKQLGLTPVPTFQTLALRTYSTRANNAKNLNPYYVTGFADG